VVVHHGENFAPPLRSPTKRGGPDASYSGCRQRRTLRDACFAMVVATQS
jgi:hypothetical protein